MIVDFVQQLIDKTDEFFCLVVQKIECWRVQNQIFRKSALGFHFLDFCLQSCDSFDQFLFFELN